MSKSTPSVYDIRVALETVLFDALTPAYNAGEVVIIQPGEELKPELQKIYIIHNVNPGTVQPGELDYRHGYAKRPGVYSILLSCPNDVDAYNDTLELAEVISDAFYGRKIPAGEGKKVFIGLVDITNPGQTPDNRLGTSVTVNWTAWAGGYEGD